MKNPQPLSCGLTLNVPPKEHFLQSVILNCITTSETVMNSGSSQFIKSIYACVIMFTVQGGFKNSFPGTATKGTVTDLPYLKVNHAAQNHHFVAPGKNCNAKIDLITTRIKQTFCFY
jgi:hypothetical protein